MQIIKLSLPLYYTFEHKKKKNETILVGMNFYRNAHHQKNNKMKKDYHDIISSKLMRGSGAYFKDKIRAKYQMKYKLYYKNSQSDLMNCVSVIDKFLQDALQELEIIQNDNVKHYVGCSVEVAGQDKENPRLECEIIGIE